MKNKIITPIVLLFFPLVSAASWTDSEAIAELFATAGVTGTCVIQDAASGRLTGNDRERAGTRMVPASTYKVPHALIGLATGAVADMDEVLPYGGGPQPFESWERDMSLREAMPLSSVPIYQALARRIGPQRMRDALRRMDYGNAEVGDEITLFWLAGPLAISAIEQADFQARLAQGRLPFDPDLQAAVRDSVRLESGDGWVLHGKTGWSNAPDPGVGWWAGWVERDGQVWAFALNMDIHRPEDAARRVELGRACLAAAGVL